MSDDNTKGGRQRRFPIEIDEDYEVRYWTKHGLSEEQVREAVRAARIRNQGAQKIARTSFFESGQSAAPGDATPHPYARVGRPDRRPAPEFAPARAELPPSGDG